MNESEYHSHVAALFNAVESVVEDAGADFDNNGGVIEIVTDSDEKIIINKQAPMREVWIASKEAGRHFRYDNEQWRDTRDGAEFMDYLRQLLERLQ